MIKYKLLHPNAKFGNENRKTEGSVGYDLYTIEDTTLDHTMSMTLVKTGVALALEHGTYATLHARSSLFKRYHVMLANSVGVIDTDYRGEILIPLVAIHYRAIHIPAGTAIAQLVFHRAILPNLVQQNDELSKTTRGSCGFGSTSLPPSCC